MDTYKHTVVLVLRRGGVFKFFDAQLLAFHLHKHYGDGLRVICLTDTISSNIQLHDMLLVPFFNKEWPGWWSKMNMFAPELEKYRPFLYIDLDTAIVGDFKKFMPDNNFNKFIALSDFYRQNLLASGILWIPEGSEVITKIWNEWIKRPEGIIKQFRGDQDFLRTIASKSAVKWQDLTTGIKSFKPKSKMWLRELPADAAIVCFHGRPKIEEAAKTVPWVKKYKNELG